ncbi:MAG: AsmA-like C-terminal region-containing protein [Candidatus Binatia bacterium]
MRKWVILAVLLFVIAVVALIAVMNLNAYLNRNRGWLAEQAGAVLGRSVHFDEIGISLRGGLGARVTNLRIAEDPAFGTGDFVKVGRADVVVYLLPALFGRYEVSRIELDAPAVTVIRTRKGFSFDSLGGAAPAAQPQASAHPAPPPTGAPAGGKALPLIVSLLRIRNGELRFLDRTTTPPSKLVVDHLDFSASNISRTAPVTIDLAAAVLGASVHNLQVAGTVGPVDAAGNYGRTPIKLRTAFGPLIINRLKRLPLVAGVLPPELSSADPITIRTTINGSLAAPSARVSLNATDAAIAYGTQFTKPKGLRCEVDLEITQSAAALRIRRLGLRLAGAALSATGTVTRQPPTGVNLQISADAVPLDGWGRLLPAVAPYRLAGTLDVHLAVKGTLGQRALPALTGSVALHDMSARQPGKGIRISGLSTTIAFKGTRVELPPSRFLIGDSPVQVEAIVNDLRSPNGTFAVTSSALRAASLGLTSEGTKEEAVLHDVDVRGSFRLAGGGPELRVTCRSARGLLQNVPYTALDATLRFRRQRLTLERVTLHAFDGTYKGSGYYDLTDAKAPVFSVQSKVQGMTLAPLIAVSFPRAAQRIAGRLDTDIRCSGKGAGWDTISKTLAGQGRMEVRDGALKDVNIAEKVLSSVTGVAGLSQLISPRIRHKYSALFQATDTPFDVLRGTVEVTGGRALIKALDLGARDYGLTGTGSLTFANQLDFTGDFVASKTLTADVIRDVKEAKYLTNAAGRLEIPFRLDGTLPHVRPHPDGRFIARALERALVGKGLDTLFHGHKKGTAPTPASAEELLRRQLEKGLHGLFGR